MWELRITMETDWEQHNIYTQPVIRCSLLRTEVIALLTASLYWLLLFHIFYYDAANWSNSETLCNLVPLIVKLITHKTFKGAHSNFYLRTSRCGVLQVTVNRFWVRRTQIDSWEYFGMSLFRKLSTGSQKILLSNFMLGKPHVLWFTK
jgi:hypothetical protein